MRKLTLFSVALFCISAALLNAHAKEALLQTTANPAIQQGYVNTAEGQLHYWVAGSGPVLLLIHQSSSSVEEYASLVPYLADQYRVVSFDWPGHGNSDDPIKELGVDEFTNSAIAVADHLNIKNMHVLGHHGGALVAMNLAWKHPRRVNKLVLSGISGLKEQAETKKFTQSLDLEKRNELDRDGKSLSDAWQRYLTYMPHSDPEQILVAYLPNIVTRLRPYDAHFGALRWDRRPALISLKERELLLMQGENDQFVSRQETLLEHLPKAERVVVKGAGLFMFYEKPDTIARLIADFLAK